MGKFKGRCNVGISRVRTTHQVNLDAGDRCYPPRPEDSPLWEAVLPLVVDGKLHFTDNLAIMAGFVAKLPLKPLRLGTGTAGVKRMDHGGNMNRHKG